MKKICRTILITMLVLLPTTYSYAGPIDAIKNVLGLNKKSKLEEALDIQKAVEDAKKPEDNSSQSSIDKMNEDLNKDIAEMFAGFGAEAQFDEEGNFTGIDEGAFARKSIIDEALGGVPILGQLGTIESLNEAVTGNKKPGIFGSISNAIQGLFKTDKKKAIVKNGLNYDDIKDVGKIKETEETKKETVKETEKIPETTKQKETIKKEEIQPETKKAELKNESNKNNLEDITLDKAFSSLGLGSLGQFAEGILDITNQGTDSEWDSISRAGTKQALDMISGISLKDIKDLADYFKSDDFQKSKKALEDFLNSDKVKNFKDISKYMNEAKNAKSMEDLERILKEADEQGLFGKALGMMADYNGDLTEEQRKAFESIDLQDLENIGSDIISKNAEEASKILGVASEALENESKKMEEAQNKDYTVNLDSKWKPISNNVKEFIDIAIAKTGETDLGEVKYIEYLIAGISGDSWLSPEEIGLNNYLSYTGKYTHEELADMVTYYYVEYMLNEPEYQNVYNLHDKLENLKKAGVECSIDELTGYDPRGLKAPKVVKEEAEEILRAILRYNSANNVEKARNR